MHCGSCVGRVTKVLNSVPGAQDVAVNLAAETAQLSPEKPEVISDALDALQQAGYPVETAHARLNIANLSCASCVGRVTRALQDVAGVIEAQVNLADETASVTFVPGVVSIQELENASTDAGYPAKATDSDDAQDRAVERDAATMQHRRDFLIAAALTLPVFVLEMGGHLIPSLHHLIGRTIGHETSWIIQFVLTTAVLLGPGRGFFANGIPALLRRAPNMNSLVALGAGSAWAFSTVALWVPSVMPQGTRAVYFEAAAVIVTLILLGRWFEARAKGRTGAAITRLVNLSPPTAKVQQGTGWVDTPVDKLHVGDVFLLQPGARVPTDGEVLEGTSFVDESMMTGEPMQIAKSTGDALTGGTVNGAGSLTCVVTKVGKDTALARIIRLVQQAQGARLPIQALVDQVTLWFVPAVLAIAIVTFGVWFFFGPAPTLSYALVAGVSVLIIACPCAMGLATPTSIMVGTGRAAELGVLFRQGDALQSLEKVRVVALDKTGTVTLGKPMLTSFDSIGADPGDAFLASIAAIEAHSEHPLAHAVLQYAQERRSKPLKANEIQVHTGRGISGIVEGRKVTVGNAALMQEMSIDITSFEKKKNHAEAEGSTVFYAADDRQNLALLVVSDPIRETSRKSIEALQERGLLIALISGDAQGTAEAVASKLGIDHVIANVLPEGKTEALKVLQAEHGKTAFVGDGINDAPVLAQADVGIAIGTGTDVAIETADVVLMSGDLLGVVRAFDLSGKTLRNIKENLIWAFGYNALLIPVAAGVLYPAFGILLSPALAAGAMAFSSVFVLANALRLRKAGGKV
ncbi:Copper-translocating P-type ATPase [Sulfitobacter noctilucicola]|nr:Copper-translocating P-type ATPase [Sulfitobacter noctilucicola]